MGIPGAMSLMEEDPRRFGRPWTCNWQEEGGDKEPAEEEPLVLLVDGMSLMYHVTVIQGGSVANSPASIGAKVTSFVSKLLQALPEQSQVRIFMDGLAPIAKLSTQIERLRQQAIKGDVLAKLEKDNDGNGKRKSTKILHLLAEWALVEAIEGLRKTLKTKEWATNKVLEMHRPSRGEAEAYIDYWIARKVPRNVKVCVLADDTDFMVYPNCPGFISFKSLVIQEEEGEVRLSGFEYTRQKFLGAFLPVGVAQDDAMPVVAALAGCDYEVNPEAQRELENAQARIVESDIGGLRQKARNSPSKAQRLTATLRFVAHYMERERDNWVEALCVAATAKHKMETNGESGNAKDGQMDDDEHSVKGGRAASILKEAFLAIRKTYFRSLTLPNNPSFEIKPTSMEVRRLLEFGIFYCRPVVETWAPVGGSPYAATSRKRSLEEVHSALDAASFAVVLSPPFSSQVAGWMAEGSVWRVPHFLQARLRLYCLLVQFARTGGAYSFEGGQLRLSPMWTNDNPKMTEYVRSNNNGGKDSNGGSTLRMQEKDVLIPCYDTVSAGWEDEAELLSGEDAVDRACLFCILGNIKQAKPALNACLRGSGILFLSTIFLPFNLALLLILSGTSPPLDGVDAKEDDGLAREELSRVLPLMSVACYHAIFISNTLVSLFGSHSEEKKQSNLTFSPSDGRSKAFEVSDVLDHEKAVWLWNAVRRGVDLEQSHTDDGDDASEMEVAMDYLDQTMDRLAAQLPQTLEWDAKMKDWKYRAKVLWVIWWEVFNVSLNTAGSTDSSTKEMNEWDKYILLLSKS